MLNPQPQYRPINSYPKWVYPLLALLLLLSIFYALPNIYGEDYAVQVRGDKGEAISPETFTEIKAHLEANGVALKKAENDPKQAVFRFNNSESQLKAKDLTSEFLRKKGQYRVALNLAPATPDWLKDLGGKPLKLGLDLKGGIHFLIEVDVDSAIDKKYVHYVAELKDKFYSEKLRYAAVTKDKDLGIVARFRDESTRDKAEGVVNKELSSEVNVRTRETGDLFELVINAKEAKLKEIKDSAVTQNIEVIRNRINQLGVAEPLVQRQGAERIIVQLPGLQDSSLAKAILGTTAVLELRIVDESYTPGTRVSMSAELIDDRDSGGKIAVKKAVMLDGTYIEEAWPSPDENGQPQINVRLSSEGGNRMRATTKKNVGQRMAIVLIETKGVYKTINGKLTRVSTYQEKFVASAPNIRESLGSQFRITGRFTPAEAHELSVVLRSGSLVAPMFIVEERTVGPSLGKQNIEMGKTSIFVGFIAVLIFMTIYYRAFGLVANVALVSNLIFIIAFMSLIPGATLTLPGIAGILLTVGMAVDANVLIFERIREELIDGVKPAQAIHNGYDKAFSTIADANITTFIAALVLFTVGSGPVAGFAVTLLIGIMTSMFTAIIGSRAIVNLIYGGKTLKKISI
jgi:preprotein translocase subunit SecD